MKDAFESFLNFERAKQKHGNEPSQISDYPEDVVETLRVFNKIWCPPSMAIPTKRQKSKFEQWVKDLRTIEDLCGTNARFEVALKVVLATYEGYSMEYQFVVDTPLKLKNLLVKVLSEMNRKKQAETVVEPEVQHPVDKVRTMKMLNELKKSLEEGETN